MTDDARGGWGCSLTKELGGWDEATLPSARQFGDARENDVGTLDNALRGVVRGLLLAAQGTGFSSVRLAAWCSEWLAVRLWREGATHAGRFCAGWRLYGSLGSIDVKALLMLESEVPGFFP